MRKSMFWIMMVSLGFIMHGNVFAQSAKADDIKGIWLNEDKDARMEIYKTGNKFFGKIVWLKTPIDPDTGKPKVDKNNPDPKKRNTPTLGLLIIKDFNFAGGEWTDGTIYDPKSGKTYKCVMKMPEKNVLDVRGYVGASWMGLGRTTTWSRVNP